PRASRMAVGVLVRPILRGRKLGLAKLICRVTRVNEDQRLMTSCLLKNRPPRGVTSPTPPHGVVAARGVGQRRRLPCLARWVSLPAGAATPPALPSALHGMTLQSRGWAKASGPAKDRTGYRSQD